MAEDTGRDRKPTGSDEAPADTPPVSEVAARPRSLVHTILKTSLRIAVFAAAVAYVVYNLDIADRATIDGETYRVEHVEADGYICVDDEGSALLVPKADAVITPGFSSIMGRATGWGLIACLLVQVAGYLTTGYRWYLLLKVQRTGIKLSTAMRLTFVGAFFNLLFPGMTMGDLVKAVYTAKRAKRKVEAVASIAVDRILGVFGIALLAGVAVLPRLTDSDYLLVVVFAWLLVAIAVVFAVVFVSRRVQDVVLKNRFMRKLPGYGVVERIAESGLLYREAKGVIGVCVVISVVTHILVVVTHWGYAMSLGATPSLAAYFAVVPVVLFISAIPVAPGGWGVGEAVYKYFFSKIGQAGALSVMLSVVFRLGTVVIGLAGAALIVGRRRLGLSEDELSKELADSLAENGAGPRPG